jgi:hypothetical protein
MSRLMIALIAMAWTGIAFGQAPAKPQNEMQQIEKGAMQQRDYPGEQAKVNKSAPKPKLTDKQKAAEVGATTSQAMQQRDYPGEQAKVSKSTPKPKVTNKQKAAEVEATTSQAMQQRDFPGEPAKAAKPAPK